ncbi:Os12g0109375 [Oryza sativa Japonica Group]|uniref:Os12g0109375 protein n=1 Tax=Oryza sativa subsp. japonica TaxID=39947 RepID=A0A0P0Y633_ORYSJ|nr:hypothetical protein EE612_057367 [Oryza sativa]BAT15537.1 Os12g0109375 [Oryza sativa Japonica Group]
MDLTFKLNPAACRNLLDPFFLHVQSKLCCVLPSASVRVYVREHDIVPRIPGLQSNELRQYMFSKLCISVNLAATKKCTQYDSICWHRHIINKLMSLLQQPSATEQIDYTTVMLNPRADVV